MSKNKDIATLLLWNAYWALLMNALEPVNQYETYDQSEIEVLVDQIREYLNGSPENNFSS